MSTGGELFGCYLQFDAIIRDQTYRRGLPSYVGGSIGYTANATMVLKLTVRDLDEGFRPSGIVYPTRAFIETADRSNNSSELLSRHESEDSTGVLFIFNPDEVMFKAAAQIVEKSSITVAYSRTAGGSDIRLPLDLTVAGLDGLRPFHSDDQVADFNGCITALLPQIEAKLLGSTGGRAPKR